MIELNYNAKTYDPEIETVCGVQILRAKKAEPT